VRHLRDTAADPGWVSCPDGFAVKASAIFSSGCATIRRVVLTGADSESAAAAAAVKGTMQAPPRPQLHIALTRQVSAWSEIRRPESDIRSL
jgi:hypothetical protein